MNIVSMILNEAKPNKPVQDYKKHWSQKRGKGKKKQCENQDQGPVSVTFTAEEIAELEGAAYKPYHHHSGAVLQRILDKVYDARAGSAAMESKKVTGKAETVVNALVATEAPEAGACGAEETSDAPEEKREVQLANDILTALNTLASTCNDSNVAKIKAAADELLELHGEQETEVAETLGACVCPKCGCKIEAGTDDATVCPDGECTK